jgi:hypothetical protein
MSRIDYILQAILAFTIVALCYVAWEQEDRITKLEQRTWYDHWDADPAQPRHSLTFFGNRHTPKETFYYSWGPEKPGGPLNTTRLQRGLYLCKDKHLDTLAC